MSILPERKTEKAIAAYLASVAGLTSVNVYTRYNLAEIVEPFISVVANSAKPYVEADPNSGNWSVAVTVSIQSNATGTDAATKQSDPIEVAGRGLAHDVLVSSVLDALQADSVLDAISSYVNTSFSADLLTIGIRKQLVEGDSFLTEQELEIVIRSS